jgi:hypothetical protein
VTDSKWIKMAEADAVHPIVDYSKVRGVAPTNSFVKSSPPPASSRRTTPPTAAMEQGPRLTIRVLQDIADESAKLTISEIEMIKQHIRTQEHPEFAV